MKIVDDFKDYELIDMSNKEKLERWNNVILRRPDPQIIWDKKKDVLWNNADAVYNRSSEGGGYWEKKKSIKDSWIVSYKDLKFNIKLMNFKHTGLFPEQAYNWEYIRSKLNGRENKKVLNLFGYTGAASVCALKEKAQVVHVDSSKGMVTWAKENVKVNNLENESIRYIVEDAFKFIKREIRRGNKYDAIIMDPPSFGKGSSGEVWKFERDFPKLLELVTELLSIDSMFVLISTYTTALSTTIIENCVKETINKKYKGTISSDEIGVKSTNGLILPCGNYIRWEKE